MRILVAPQELKGTLTATLAAEAIARGLRRALPSAELDLLPFSDGGPGFLDALEAASPSQRRSVTAHDATGRPIEAAFLLLDGGATAVIEAAQSNGLSLLLPDRLDPLYADTFGVGELIAAALVLRPSRVIVGVGGSATTDGGSGMARALGARFLDEAGRELPPGGAPLAALASIEWRPPAAAAGVEFVVATDVSSPLVGPDGAARVFAPQKGATPDQVEQLEAALLRYAGVLRASLGKDVARVPGAGAAGGLAAGLAAFLGARIVSGFDVVAEATGLADRLQAAGLIVTGEGSFDDQSSRGKVTGRLLAMAAESGKPAVVLAGRSTVTGIPLARDPSGEGERGTAPGVSAGNAIVHSLAEVDPDPAKQMENAAPLLEELAYRAGTGIAPR